MRIRKSTIHHTTPSYSSSPPSPPSSSSSSSTTHSTISTHSLTSSSNSTSSSISARRCTGLDLLVKAVYHLAGSVIGVPYIQRRVIRRRKRPLNFNHFIIDSMKLSDQDANGVEDGEVFDHDGDLNEARKQRRRSNSLPFKYKDSVLQNWKTNNRRRKRSSRC